MARKATATVTPDDDELLVDELPDAASANGTGIQEPTRRQAREEAEAIYDWLSEFGAPGDIRVELIRREPRMYKRVKTDGLLQSYSQPIGLDEIQQIHGGGKYQLKVHARKLSGKGAGKWQYAGARTFDIAGNPNIESLLSPEDDDADDDTAATAGAWGQRGAAPNPFGPISEPLGAQAMNMAKSLAQDARDEARQLREMGRSDPQMTALIDRLQQSLSDLQQQIARKDEQLLELLAKPKDHHAEDRLVEMLRDGSKDHSTRVQELRLAHDAELRQLRDFNMEDVKRRESRYERDLDYARQAHQRDIDTLKESSRAALDTQKQSYELRIETLRESVARVERELSEARMELAALRAKKDVGPLEQMQTLAALRDAFKTVMPEPAEDEDKSTGLERALGRVMESPIAQGLAQRLAGPGGAGGADGAGDPMVAVRLASGGTMQLPASYVKRMNEQQGVHQPGPGAPTARTPALGKAAELKLSRAEVRSAVGLLENAYRSGQDPAVVAATARNMVPGNILEFLNSQGVDAFLSEVAEVSASSPLSTVVGRRWVRTVAQILLHGELEEATESGDSVPSVEPEPELEHDAIADAMDEEGNDELG